MTLKEKILYHQIHPLKLAADVSCALVSLYFFWRHNVLVGLATHFIPPIAASVLLIRYGHLEALKSSRAGAYLKRHMTRTVEGVRSVGDIVMVLGAWFHQPALIAVGLAVVIMAWSNGLIRKPASN